MGKGGGTGLQVAEIPVSSFRTNGLRRQKTRNMRKLLQIEGTKKVTKFFEVLVRVHNMLHTFSKV